MINVVRVSIGVVMGLFLLCGSVGAQSSGLTGNLYNLGKLKPFDSELKVKSGEMAPDFTLPAVSGEKITLNQYRGKKNGRDRNCNTKMCKSGEVRQICTKNVQIWLIWPDLHIAGLLSGD